VASSKTQPARGMRDFLPADVRRREYVIGVIKEVYERYGFEPLETPAVENIETLMGKYGEEGNQLIFKILMRGEHEASGKADLALRYDLTVPLARVVAQYQNELPKFFKRYQIQPVWRADRPARGRFREFYQCDVDILGSRSVVVEAELIAAASDALVALGFDDFEIRLNHRKLLNGFLSAFGVNSEKQADALAALDKLEKIGMAGVAKELKQRGIADEATARLLDFFDKMADIAKSFNLATSVVPPSVKPKVIASVNEQVNAGLLKQVRKDLASYEMAQSGLDELDSIVELTKANGSSGRVRIDLGLARGLSYYTGSIMEIRVEGIGSLGGGGRYDNLVGMFLGKEVPACGFSLGLERIIVVMTEREMFQTKVRSPADIMVTVSDVESLSDSLALATELRREGKRVDVYPEPDKLKKQLAYAATRRIPEVAIVGSEERTHEIVSLKNMQTGNQRHEMRLSWKREIFREFLKRTNMPVDFESIATSEVSGLNFTCEVDGQIRYFKLTEIVDEDLARNYNISMKTMEPHGGAFSQEEPLRRVFQARASRPYHVGDIPIELVAYYDKQAPPTYDPQMIPRTIGRTAEYMIESRGWARVWVYDTRHKQVLWAYPHP
jgi:histidyl-tRNA synthetase